MMKYGLQTELTTGETAVLRFVGDEKSTVLVKNRDEISWSIAPWEACEWEMVPAEEAPGGFTGSFEEAFAVLERLVDMRMKERIK